LFFISASVASADHHKVCCSLLQYDRGNS